jgi:hypothetical protein
MSRSIARLALFVVAVSCSSDSNAPDDGDDAGRHIAVHAGATQAGTMGQPTPVAPAVIIANDAGDPVAGVVVTFSVASGGGSTSATTATTNAAGIASASWTLGKTFATQALDATVTNVGSVGFLATAIAPDAGILAFNASDPGADTLPYVGPPAPIALDLVGIRGDFKRDSLILTLTFSSAVSDGALGGSNGLFGLLEFDIDDRITTGESPEANAFGATASLGIDFLLDLFDENGTRETVLYAATGQQIVPSTVSGNTMVVRIPMQLLGSDDGSFSVVGVIGLIDRATDIIPNTGGVLVRPNGG